MRAPMAFNGGMYLLVLALLLPGRANAQDTNLTVSNQVCKKGDWQASSYFGASVSSDQFTVNSTADIKSYAMAHVRQKLYPNAVLLVIAIVLLVFFILWRFFKCCCACCCGWCKPSKNPAMFIRGRGMTVSRVLVTLMGIGVVASCIYGMTKVSPHLVSQGLSVVDSVKNQVQQVLNVAYAMVGLANGGLGLLGDLQTIVNVDVNFPLFLGYFGQVIPWLSRLIDPAQIQTMIDTLDSTIQGSLTPINANLTRDLNQTVASLPSLNLSEYQIAGTGNYLFSTTSPIGYKQQVSNYQSEVSAMVLQTSSDCNGDSGNCTVLYNDLQLLTDNSVTNLTGKLAYLAATNQSINVLTAFKSNGTVSNAIAELQSLQSVAGNLTANTLPNLSATLRNMSSDYMSVRPALLGILAQMQHINDTVILLPTAMQTSYNELADAQQSLDAFYLGSAVSPMALANQTDHLADSLTLPNSTNMTLAALQGVQASLNNMTGLGAMTTYITQLYTATSNANSAVGQAWSAYHAYNATTNKTPGNYTTMQSAQSAASSQLNSAGVVALLGNGGSQAAMQLLSQQAASLASATSALYSNSSSPQSQLLQVGKINASIANLPNLTSYDASLNKSAAAFANLGTNRTAVLDSALNTLTNLVTNINNTVNSTEAKITSYIGQITDKVNQVDDDTVGRINSTEAKWMPDVNRYDKYRQIASQCYLALAIFLSLMCVLVVWIHFQWGASFFTFLLCLVTVLYCIVGAIFLVIAVVGNDGCSNAETTLVQQVGSRNDKVGLLLDYYLFNQGGTLSQVADQATGVNFDSMEAQLNSTATNAVSGVTGQYTLRYKLQAVVDGILGLAGNVTSEINTAMDLVDYAGIHPLYLQAKSFICCDAVSNMFGDLWLSMFVAGVMSLVLIMSMFAYIKRLDELPARRCCGCALRSAKEFDKHAQLDPKLAAIRSKGAYKPAVSGASMPGTPGYGTPGGSVSAASSPWTLQPTGSAFDDRENLIKASEQSSGSKPAGALTPADSTTLESLQIEVGGPSASEGSATGSLLSPGAKRRKSERLKPVTKSDQRKEVLKKALRLQGAE